jgi:glucose-1-phosphate cytidylyltransferase
VNGGYFILSPKVIDYIDGDTSIWEQEPLKTLAEEGQLSAFQHKGFWQPMDTLRDKMHLEELWQAAKAPWKVW